MSHTRPDKGPRETETADEAHELFAGFKPEARDRMVKFLDALDKHLEEHPPTGTLESVVGGLLESVNELPPDERGRIKKFLDALNERFGSPPKLDS